MNKKMERLVFGFLSRWLAPPLLRALRASNRMVVEGEQFHRELVQEDQNFILAFWHGQMLPLLFYFREGGFYTFISPHRDGEYIARALEGMGHHSLRTSLRDRRLRALARALRLARDGHTLVVTPDGPVGPRFEAKAGIVRLSEKTELPILPAAAMASRARFFSSWDRFVMPLPLGTIRVVFDEPIRLWETDRTMEQKQDHIERVLNRLTRRAVEVLPQPSKYVDQFSVPADR